MNNNPQEQASTGNRAQGPQGKAPVAEVERKLPIKAREMRVSLMLDSIRGDNDFTWWGEPRLKA